MLDLQSVSWPVLDRYASASDEELVTLPSSYPHTWVSVCWIEGHGDQLECGFNVRVLIREVLNHLG